MSKILIIGQALPAVKQTVPYDTTLLYTMLEWAGVSKESAQEMFEFEAVCGSFPGHGSGGHLKPTTQQMNDHWYRCLQEKVYNAKKVWILGNVAFEFLTTAGHNLASGTLILRTPHPSRRNYNRIMDKKEEITSQLKTFLFS